MQAKIIQMLQLQDKFNSVVDADWRNDLNRSDCLAIAMEAAELVEHLGWKWWKHQVSNPKQAQMELVDIWHFLMSDIIRGISKEEIAELKHDDFLIKNLVTELSYLADGIDGIKKEHIHWQQLRLATMLMTSAGANVVEFGLLDEGVNIPTTDSIMYSFTQLLYLLNMNFDVLYQWYIGKNALNHFRQSNGYKDGSYIKEWNGKEDNEYLVDIVETLAQTGSSELFDETLALMQAEYDSNAKIN